MAGGRGTTRGGAWPDAPAGRLPVVCRSLPRFRSVLPGLCSLVFLFVAARVSAATFDVSGAGWWDSRKLERTLELMVRPGRTQTMPASTIEDAALILVAELQRDGYLKPLVRAKVHSGDGEVREFTWDASVTTFLPRPMHAESVTFHVEPGVRYHIEEVAIGGLTALSDEEGQAFFMSESYLLPLASTRIFTPSRFQRSQSNLEEELRRKGYASASVTGETVSVDDSSGEVRLKVSVVEGPRWKVSSIALEGPEEGKPPADLFQRLIGRPYSSILRQNLEASLRNHYLGQGFVDVQVRLSAKPGEPQSGERPVDVTATIEPGVRVEAGPVKFKGSDAVVESVLRRQVHLKPGEPLNPLDVADARLRISRLGVFKSVEADYEPATGPVRSPVFELEEGRRRDLDLLLGWGSYERLRGGIEYRHYNLFSRGHQLRADLVQSLKSSSGELNYTVPELFGESIEATAKVFGLRREERAFKREEFGGSIGASRYLHMVGGDVSAMYTYQSLRISDSTLATAPVDLGQATVASLDLAYSRDQLDHPLRPRHGYRTFVRAELAAKLLGGEVNYQRLELGATWHTRWGRGRWIHAGLSHGIVTTLGASGVALPVNKRFFPGGENSVRGYPSGGAAPRAADGSYVGAKTYLQLNIELEQALTRSWSVVGFTDWVGVSARIADYPYSQLLGSVGLGIRYHSLIGPIRLEYGRNTNRRPGDPAGTLHFSVGFPF